MKMQAGKVGTHSKGFPENIAKVFRALNAPVKRSLKKITVISEAREPSLVFSKVITFPYVF